MTAAQGDGWGVTEAEVEVAALSLYAALGGACSRNVREMARNALEAAAAARPAPAEDAEEVARLRAVLRQMEWDAAGACPSCDGWNHHRYDCALAAALAPERTPS